MMRALGILCTMLVAHSGVFADRCSDLSSRPETPTDRLRACVEVDLDRDGQDELVVATTNDDDLLGVVRVYARNGQDENLVTELHPEGMLGGTPEIELVDFAKDGSPEMVVSMASGSGIARQDWILSWDGARLVDLTPTAPKAEGGLGAPSGGMNFVDYDGDGDTDAVENYFLDEPDPVLGSAVLFTWEAGRFATGERLAWWSQFERHKNQPVRESESFVITNVSRPYAIRIYSAKGPSSARVWLNGVAIATPDDFRNSPARKEVRPVQLQQENKIDVEVAGAPESTIYVFVVPG